MTATVVTTPGRRRTVLVALAANVFVAVVKLVAAVVSGSKVLLAEAGHSIADCLNEVLLLVALWRGRRPATARHPFGFGKEQFFWSLLAAIAIFVTGAVVAVNEGIRALSAGDHRVSSAPLALGVLAVAGAADGVSLSRAIAQLRTEARRAGLSLFAHVRRTTDPTVRTVLLEDGAGLIGVAVAAVALALHQLTGNARWDAAGAIAVGLVLAAVAFEVGRDSRALLLGEGAHPDEVAALQAAFASHADALELVELFTMRLGPDSLLVAAHVDLNDRLTAVDIESLAERVGLELIAAVAAVSQVFLDPTARPSSSRAGGE